MGFKGKVLIMYQAFLERGCYCLKVLYTQCLDDGGFSSRPLKVNMQKGLVIFPFLFLPHRSVRKQHFYDVGCLS